MSGSLLMFLVAFVLLIVIYACMASHALRTPLVRTRNPYTFHCKICGQQFDTYQYAWSDRHTWLEPMYDIRDPKCVCHDWAKTRGIVNALERGKSGAGEG